MEDKETQQVLSEAKQLQSLVGSEGWSVARGKLTQKIIDLQNAFNIEDKSADEMLVDLKARKQASLVLFDWLRDVEGTASGADDVRVFRKSYIITKEI